MLTFLAGLLMIIGWSLLLILVGVLRVERLVTYTKVRPRVTSKCQSIDVYNLDLFVQLRIRTCDDSRQSRSA